MPANVKDLNIAFPYGLTLKDFFNRYSLNMVSLASVKPANSFF